MQQRGKSYKVVGSENKFSESPESAGVGILVGVLAVGGGRAGWLLDASSSPDLLALTSMELLGDRNFSFEVTRVASTGGKGRVSRRRDLWKA